MRGVNSEGMWDLGQVNAQPPFRIYLLVLFYFANDSSAMPTSLGKYSYLKAMTPAVR